MNRPYGLVRLLVVGHGDEAKPSVVTGVPIRNYGDPGDLAMLTK
jgi:hypothetical protein